MQGWDMGQKEQDTIVSKPKMFAIQITLLAISESWLSKIEWTTRLVV